MKRRDRILILLEHYVDVLGGIYDASKGTDEGVLALMCRAWNHPSYRELERLRLHMRDAEPEHYWHLAETYFRAERRRIATCPKCQREASPALIGELCNHGSKHSGTATMVPLMMWVVHPDVDPKMLAQAIDWLDWKWTRGDASIPDDLRPDRKDAA